MASTYDSSAAWFFWSSARPPHLARNQSVKWIVKVRWHVSEASPHPSLSAHALPTHATHAAAHYHVAWTHHPGVEECCPE